MSLLRRDTVWQKASKSLAKRAGAPAVRSGLTAGATLLVLSAGSAVTSAVRRRQERR